MPNTMSPPSQAMCFTLAVLMFLLVAWELGASPASVLKYSSHHRAFKAQRDSQGLEMNRTLGFERVFVINLPERSDKRDTMVLAASLTNISIEFVDGVKGESIPDKALPFHAGSRSMPENMLGSWRAHMNTIRKVVEQGLSSALIIEDDSDWDIRIKQQLAQVAKGTRWLQHLDADAPTHSPYGDAWDLLWIGHCVDAMDEQDQRIFVIPDDASAPDYHRLYHPHNVVPSWISSSPPHSRLVHPLAAPVCTFAYAVSYRGAQRVLYSLSVKELRGLFDNALAWMCRDKTVAVRCFGVYPSLFDQHRAAGRAGKNSDNSDTSPKLDHARTDGLQWPTKMNLEKLLTGQTDFVDQYP